jgi:hypothetical protein
MQMARGERVLAASRAADGSYLLATDRALHHAPPVAEPGRASRGGIAAATESESLGRWRLPYEDILRAEWDDETGALRVWEPSLPAGQTEIPLPSPGALPETVRERVTATVVVSQHVPLRGRQGVWLSARRAPGAAAVHWTALFDAGLDPSDPGLRALAAAALEDLRHTTGV